MSVLSKIEFEGSASSYPTLAVQGTPKIFELNGKKRNIEKISSDDFGMLDREIKRLQSVGKSEGYKSTAWLVVATVLAFIVIGFGASLGFSGGPLAWMTGVVQFSFLSFFIPMWVISLSHEEKSSDAYEEAETVKTLQRAMHSEEFRTFVRNAGDSFTIDELKKVHVLFKAINNFKEITSESIFFQK